MVSHLKRKITSIGSLVSVEDTIKMGIGLVN